MRLRAGLGLLVVAAVVACGGDDDDAALDVAEGTTALETSTSSSAGGASSSSTTEPERARVPLPAGGPVDQVFPPGDAAYERLVAGECRELREETATWEGQGVADAEGRDTIELYRSAAHACLAEWDDAIAAFDRITASDFGGVCARQRVYAWLAPLIEARRGDAGFDPVFVRSESVDSSCDAEETTASSEDTTTTSSEDPTTTSSEDTTTTDTAADGAGG